MCKSLFKRRFLNRYDKVEQMKVCVCVCVGLERQRWGDTANNSWRNAALFTRGSHLKAAVIC